MMIHRTHSLATALAITLIVALAAPAVAGDSAIDFETAKAQAAARGVPVVIDFFTDWCVYCKHFDRDLADASTGLAEDLEAVVFTSIDAEKGDGIELAKTYEVTGFPTYVVVDAQGALIDRWSGYGGPDHFRTAYDRALEDPRPLAVKRAEFEEAPTAALAVRFGELEAGAGRYDAAIALYRQAEQLDPLQDQSSNVLMAAFGKLRRGGDAEALDGFLESARATIEGDDVPTGTVVMAAQMVGAMAPRLGRPEAELPFLEAALAALERDDEGVDPRAKAAIEVAGHLKVTKDVDAAVAAKKASLDEGWQDDPDELNAFAWWCFENEVNLEEARTLAAKGVELSRPGKQRAMVLDTLAEICNAMGDCGDALESIETAIAEAPDDKHYQRQRERFAALLEEKSAADE